MPTHTLLFNAQPLSEKHTNFHCNSFLSIKNEHVHALSQALNKLAEKYSPEQVIIVATEAEKHPYKKDQWLRLVISNNEDYGGFLQIHYQNGYKRLPTTKLTYDYDLDMPDAHDGLAVVSTPNVSQSSENTEPYDEITWGDFEFSFMLKKVDPISSLADGLQNYLIVDLA